MAEPNDFASAMVDQMYPDHSRAVASGANAANGERHDDGPATLSAELPPIKQKTADEILADMKKIPLFMTSLDDLDEGNEQLEALKALAYEGTRAEIAENFRNQGNECAKQKQFRDAREFYTKALQALKAPRQAQPPEQIASDAKVVEVDDEEDEERKERTIEEACHANRALCNLEMKNYGSCQRDCAAALRLNPRNIKAWYRAASACLAIDKMPEALDACETGLKYEAANAALRSLLTKVEKRRDHLTELEEARREREERLARERTVLRQAIKQRGIKSRTTDRPPNTEDAVVKLSDPLDPRSTLSFPVIVLYPLHAQSDFIKELAEDDSLGQHLDYILPTPWDEAGEYTKDSVDCYMETVDGGLIKAGKNLSMSKLLGSGKVEVVDELVKVNVVSKANASQWIEEFKKRRGRN